MIGTSTGSLILSAALELFAQHGYEKTTMRAIAKKVGIQSASIYYFFGSKECLLETIFSEFETNFAKHRNPPADIFRAAKEKPLPEVLSMLFYTFGSAEERDRMMTISRVILSLQYEHTGAHELFERVFVQDAMEYGMEVLRGLHTRGIIKAVDFRWTAFMFHSFAAGVFQENLRHLKQYAASDREYEKGIRVLCESFAVILAA